MKTLEEITTIICGMSDEDFHELLSLDSDYIFSIYDIYSEICRKKLISFLDNFDLNYEEWLTYKKA